MALINCYECGKEISDKASLCIGCGAPIIISINKIISAYNPDSDTFHGGLKELFDLAVKSVNQNGWKVLSINEQDGILVFKTRISWGSFSGVIGTINFNEISPGVFKIDGKGKQNEDNDQAFTFNFGNEAQKKVIKMIETMKKLAPKKSLLS